MIQGQDLSLGDFSARESSFEFLFEEVQASKRLGIRTIFFGQEHKSHLSFFDFVVLKFDPKKIRQERRDNIS